MISLKIKCFYQRKNLISGSITVEAAFVMPIVILAVFALIYLAFYLHDICRIQSVMDLTLYQAGITLKQEADLGTGEVSYDSIGDSGILYLLTGQPEDKEMQIKKYLMQELAYGLFLTKIKNTKVEAEKFRIKISITAETKVTLPGISYLFDPFSNTVITGEYPIHNPAESIRCMEVILETGSRIKGVDEIKMKIKDIFDVE